MRVSELNIYPIKSLKGIRVESATVEERGFVNDRRWVLTTTKGEFLTQRELPQMALIATAMRDGELFAAANGLGEIPIPRLASGKRQKIAVFETVSDALEYDESVNDWFSKALGAKVRLFYMPDDAGRPLNPRFAKGGERVSFADAYPILAIGERSLAELNSRLAKPIPMERFRPNIVIEGTEAFEEDGWEKIRVGETIFRAAKHCGRCPIPTVDQNTGKKAGKEPLATLAKFRLAETVIPERLEELGVSPKSMLFGKYFIPETLGESLSVGDRVEVLETSEQTHASVSS